MKLRPYQQDAVNATFNYFEQGGGNPVIAMPTGTGKSIVISEIIRNVFQFPKQRVMMLTHVKELIAQNHKNLITVWPTAPVGIFSAGLDRRDVGRPITYAGIQSVHKRAATFGHVNIVIVDEAHLIPDNADTMYGQFISDLRDRNPNLKVIGLTATPYRLGSGLLTDGPTFDDVCFDLTSLQNFNKLVADGFIAPLIAKRPGTELDVSDVKMSGGDYVLKALQAAVDKEAITAQALDELAHAGTERKHWLIFATGIEHSNHIRDKLNSMGIPAGVVHSKLSDEERANTLARFKDGTLRAVVNNNVLTTGFDFPGIDLIGMLRPTKSTGLWVQMLGRGTRPAEGKTNCLVLDFAGNTKTLGPINDPIIPSKRNGNGGGGAPYRECEECSTYNHISVRFCITCGFEFPRNVGLSGKAFSDAVMKLEESIEIEIWEVLSVTYGIHEKEGKPDSLRVYYDCGIYGIQSEWVCLQHTGFAQHKAHDWWRKRMDTEPPATVEEAMKYLGQIQEPTHIKVRTDQKYNEIKEYDFHNNRFGEKHLHEDDDIPF